MPSKYVSYYRHWSRLGWVVELPDDHPDAFCGGRPWMFVFRESTANQMAMDYNVGVLGLFKGEAVKRG